MSDDTLVTALQDVTRGAVHAPGSAPYDEQRTGYQQRTPHAPAAVVVAADAADVRAVLALAADRGLPVAAQSSGHGLARPLDGGVLISTRALTGVRVDPDTATARVEAGASWQQVVDAAAPYGLAPLSGSAPGVGAVSYTLGGGIGLLVRRHGAAADRLRSAELVTAGGVAHRVDAEHEPELFLALRGGGGGLGIVTAMEIGLVPVTGLYGGGLYAEATPAALAAWRRWTEGLGRDTTTGLAMLAFPDFEGVPDELRGRYAVQVQVAHAGPAAEGERAVAPLRDALGPVLRDTLHELPFTASGSAFEEPEHPHAYLSDNRLVGGLDDAALAHLVASGAPDAALPTVTTVRHLGGALATAPDTPSAVGHRDAAYAVTVLHVAEADQVEQARALQRATFAPLEATALGRALNFCYGPLDPEQVSSGFEPDVWKRLVALKAAHDPDDRIRANHPIPAG